MGAKPVLVHTAASFHLRFEPAPPWATYGCMLLTDSVALSLVYWLAVLGRHYFNPGYTLASYLELFPAIILFLAAFMVQGLYPGLLLHPAEEMRRVFHCLTIVLLLVASSTFLWRNAESYSRSIFLFTWASGVPVVLFARSLARSVFAPFPWWGIPAVVLGSGPAAQRVLRYLQNPRNGVRVKGVLTDEHYAWDPLLPPLLGGLSAAREMSVRHAAHYAILAMPQKSNTELRQIIQDHCRAFRHLLLLPDFPGVCTLGVTARELGGEVALEMPQRLCHTGAAFTKVCLDIFLAGLALLLLSPLLLLICLAIKVTSPGPLFYGHLRCGRDGKTFKALKFRTMLPNGDEVLTEYFRRHPDQMAAWQRDQKLKMDPRVTAIGRWLRRFSLDELPQLLNVLRGEMSVVGPRPIIHAEIAKYGTGYGLYTRVLPGITGLWQISGRSNTTYEERVAFDQYYVTNWSIWLDAYILARTVKVVLAAEGAY